VDLYSALRSASNAQIVPMRRKKMSFQSRSEAVGTPNRVPERVWKRVPFHRTHNGESPTTKRAAMVSWRRLAVEGVDGLKCRMYTCAVSGDVAVSGADLQFGGHNGANARGRTKVHDRRQLLAIDHAGIGKRHQLPGGHRPAQHAQSTRGGQQTARGNSAWTQRLPRNEEALLPTVSDVHAVRASE